MKNLEEMKAEPEIESKGLIRFIVPSLFGVFIFLFPVFDGQTFNIPLGVITQFIIDTLANYLPLIVTLVIVISTVMSIITALFKPSFIKNSETLTSLFDTTPFWLVTRILGAIFAIMTFTGAGWSLIYSDVTGQVMYGLLTTLICWFFVGSFLMPYLINFGIMEFFGTLARRIVKPFFTLPGRSAIDLLASWIGNVNVGVVLTKEQYERGFYTGREAAAIVTCFSTVSLPFCLVIASMLGLDHIFPVFYLTIVIAGIICAMIIPRIPPLSRIPDTYYSENDYTEEVPKDTSAFRWALSQAVERAKKSGTFLDQLKQGNDIFLGIAFVLLPQVMAIGVVALIIAEYTPFFQVISQPIVPILEWMQLPEAQEAAPAMIVGFIDMFLPAILGAGIEAEITRFVVGTLSLVQIIYLTEMGTLLLISKIPIKLWHLFVLFIQRTVISLPVIVIIAHIIY